jgi:hypothetical protein
MPPPGASSYVPPSYGQAAWTAPAAASAFAVAPGVLAARRARARRWLVGCLLTVLVAAVAVVVVVVFAFRNAPLHDLTQYPGSHQVHTSLNTSNGSSRQEQEYTTPDDRETVAAWFLQQLPRDGYRVDQDLAREDRLLNHVIYFSHGSDPARSGSLVIAPDGNGSDITIDYRY